MADNVIRFEFAGSGSVGSGKGATAGTGGGASSPTRTSTSATNSPGRSPKFRNEYEQDQLRYGQLTAGVRAVGRTSESYGNIAARLGVPGAEEAGAAGGLLSHVSGFGLAAGGGIGLLGAGALGVGLAARYTSHKADELAPFSPDIAIAKAERRVSDLQQNIHEAQVLGPDIARFQEAQTRLLNDIHELLLPIKHGVIQLAAAVMEFINQVIEWMRQKGWLPPAESLDGPGNVDSFFASAMGTAGGAVAGHRGERGAANPDAGPAPGAPGSGGENWGHGGAGGKNWVAGAAAGAAGQAAAAAARAIGVKPGAAVMGGFRIMPKWTGLNF